MLSFDRLQENERKSAETQGRLVGLFLFGNDATASSLDPTRLCRFHRSPSQTFGNEMKFREIAQEPETQSARNGADPLSPEMGENRGKYRTLDFLLMLGIVLLGTSLRLAYLAQISDPDINPFFDEPTMDSRHYDSMAEGYANGDWLGERAYWYSPFYPYFVGIFYSLIGRDFLLLSGFQLILGGLHCAVVFAVGRALFGRLAGVIAGLLMATYKVAFFYEALLLKTGLSALLLDLGLLLVFTLGIRQREKPLPEKSLLIRLLLTGIALGIAAITSGTMILLAGWATVWIFLAKRPFRLRPALALAAGVALAVTPVTIRNAIVSSDFVPISYNAGPVFYTGNCPYNTNGSQIHVASFLAPVDPLEFQSENEEGFFFSYAQSKSGELLAPSEVSSYWFKKGFEWVSENPGTWFLLTLKKIRIFFNDYEVPNNQSFDLFRTEFAPILDLRFFPTFGILGAFGLVGMVLSVIKRRRGTWLSLPFFWLFAFSIILNFVVSRYRFPVTGLLAAFSGFTAASMVTWCKAKKWMPAGITALSSLVLLWLLHLPLPDFDRDLSDGYRMLAQAYQRKERLDLAEENFKKAIEVNDRSFSAFRELGLLQLQSGQRIQAQGNRPAANLRFKEAQENFTRSYLKSPSLPEQQTSLYLAALMSVSSEEEEVATRLASNGLTRGEDCRLYFVRALAKKKTDVKGALEDLGHALRIHPEYPDALIELGSLLASEGKHLEAMDAYCRILSTRKSDSRALSEILLLVQALKESSDESTAAKALELGIEHHPQEPGLLNELAWLYATASDNEIRKVGRAEVLSRKAVALSPHSPQYLDTLAEILFGMGKKKEAADTIDQAIQWTPKDDPDFLRYLKEQRLRFLGKESS